MFTHFESDFIRVDRNVVVTSTIIIILIVNELSSDCSQHKDNLA